MTGTDQARAAYAQLDALHDLGPATDDDLEELRVLHARLRAKRLRKVQSHAVLCSCARSR